MCSISSTSWLPNGRSARTHSTLRTPNGRLVGRSIQFVYETSAHNSRARKGVAIKMRRRRRLRLAAGSCRRSRRDGTRASGDGTRRESVDRRSTYTRTGTRPAQPLYPVTPCVDRPRHDKENGTRSLNAHPCLCARTSRAVGERFIESVLSASVTRRRQGLARAYLRELLSTRTRGVALRTI